MLLSLLKFDMQNICERFLDVELGIFFYLNCRVLTKMSGLTRAGLLATPPSWLTFQFAFIAKLLKQIRGYDVRGQCIVKTSQV